MEKETNLLQTRQIAYESLFSGECPDQLQPEFNEIGLAGLWRVFSQKFGRNSIELRNLLDTVPSKVATILTEHDELARSATDSNEAIFSMIDPTDTLNNVSDITSCVIGIWEKALFKNSEEPIFSKSKDKISEETDKRVRLVHFQTPESLVIETAAVVMQVLPIWSETPFNPSKADKTNLAQILANWGPGFLKQWMDGTILNKWIEKQSIADTEAQEYNEIFTPGLLKHFVINNISDPLAILDKVAKNLAFMTDEVLAEYLEWTEEEVKEILTPGLRKRFAVNNISNPLDALDKFAANLDLLSDEVLIECLGWSESDVIEKLTPGLRKHIAVRYSSDPLAAVIDYIEGNIPYSNKRLNSENKSKYS